MKVLIRISMPHILLIQETKMEEQSFLKVAHSYWFNAQCIVVSSRGASGGLETLWDQSKVELVSVVTTTHWIFTEILFKETNL